MRLFTSPRVKLAEIIEGIARPSTLGGPSALLFADRESVDVDAAYMKKHVPVVGGYYIKYLDDGYESFCPADVFELHHEEVAVEYASVPTPVPLASNASVDQSLAQLAEPSDPSTMPTPAETDTGGKSEERFAGPGEAASEQQA